MRKAMVGVAVLLAAAGLSAGRQAGDAPIIDGQKAEVKSPTKAAPDRPEGQGDLESLELRAAQVRHALAKAAEQAQPVSAKQEVLNAEHQVRVATLEAEYRVKPANLDRERIESASEVNLLQAQLEQLNGELARAQGARGRRGGPPVAPPPGALAPVATNPPPSSDQKLDAILQRLADMDARLKRLEDRR